MQARGVALYTMQFDSLNRVLMARVEGVLTLSDVIGINADAALFVERESVVRFLLDLSAVDVIDIPQAVFVERARQRAALPVEDRVCVASTPLVFGMARLYAAHQGLTGNREPIIVGSMDEAYQTLNLVDPEFRPLQTPALGSKGSMPLAEWCSGSSGRTTSPRETHEIKHAVPPSLPETARA